MVVGRVGQSLQPTSRSRPASNIPRNTPVPSPEVITDSEPDCTVSAHTSQTEESEDDEEEDVVEDACASSRTGDSVGDAPFRESHLFPLATCPLLFALTAFLACPALLFLLPCLLAPLP